MKTRLIPTLSLLVLLLASCAPGAGTTESPPQPAAPIAVEPSATPLAPAEPVRSAQDPATESVAAPTDVSEPTPFPVATSRGPNLEATDPRTVHLASGGLQFVEFFRFT